jgi:hypothetical protein
MKAHTTTLKTEIRNRVSVLTQTFLFLVAFSLWHTSLLAQSQTQIVRGKVYDKASEEPLVGATIILEGATPTIGTTTDLDGKFVLPNVPLGRKVFLVQSLGYNAITVPEVLVTSGKEVVLEIKMEEAVTKMNEVVVTAASNKDKANNEFSTISSRTFSVEEVTRYSGGRNDMARLAANFAGVSTSNDSRNDIVVRGNSPTGVLWRLEGIPIPNPNHFSTLGTTGGPVSAMNTNLLKNSDFLTGAFAPEYGNANSGVFDVAFRNGNSEQHEYTFQLNMFSGLEAMAEGPLSKAKKSSYVAAYRYSFAGIGSALGIPIGTAAAPQYQDLSFKFDFANNPKFGKFSLFGIAGYSYIEFIGNELTDEDLFADPYSDRYARSMFGVLGLKHTYSLKKGAYLKTVVSGTTSNAWFQQYDFPEGNPRTQVVENKDLNQTFRISSTYNKKYNAKLNLRSGLLAEVYLLNTKLTTREDRPEWQTIRDFNGTLALIQPYAQLQYKINEQLTLNGGLHGQYLTNNNTYSVEPRASFAYQFLPRHTVTLAYGWHSQMQPLPVYFYRTPLANGTYDESNKDLDFTRSHHIVLAYDIKIKNDWRIKFEPYVQFVTGAPVDGFSSSFSMLNAGADFVFPDRGFLVNDGIGRNAGLELTIEKFFSKGYYALITTSLYDSKYKGSDNVWRNTAFNNRYVFNALAGKEFKVGKEKRNAISLDFKFTTSGGRYYTPVDLTASKIAGREILDEENAFSKQLPAYLRLDTKVGFRLNSKSKKFSQSFYIDFQNVTNNKNIFERRYNQRTGTINDVNQIGFFPDVMYRVQF